MYSVVICLIEKLQEKIQTVRRKRQYINSVQNVDFNSKYDHGTPSSTEG